jgi:uncharacterized protein YxeA
VRKTMNDDDFGIFFTVVVLIVLFIAFDGCSNMEKNTIEGTIQQTEITTNPDKIKISFQDGRVKTLNGMSQKPLDSNKYYKITYNGSDFIKNVEEIK